MAVISGGVVYGLAALARVRPLLIYLITTNPKIRLLLPHHLLLRPMIPFPLLVVTHCECMIQKYLLPHLQPPSSTSFQSTSAALTEQYDEAARLLSELQDQTTRLQEGIDGDRERVNGVVGGGEVEGGVEGDSGGGGECEGVGPEGEWGAPLIPSPSFQIIAYPSGFSPFTKKIRAIGSGETQS